ncbi:hypothetical protein [Peribacillus deserti]|nr:hypothetical protein [Peribacillus deserti]
MLIIQPKLEKQIAQLEAELQKTPYVDIVLFPEGYLNENIEQACTLAKQYNVFLIGGYRKLNESPKDRAVLINRQGEVILDRVKYSATSFETVGDLKVGHILCDELILQGVKSEETGPDLIVHPIGVGMFSEEQFEEWIAKAKEIAVTHKVMIVGSSHADGSYRDSEISIPIQYALDRDGSEIFISHNDARARILDLKKKCIETISSII